MRWAAKGRHTWAGGALQPEPVLWLWLPLAEGLSHRLLPLLCCLSLLSPPTLEEDSALVPSGDIPAAGGTWGECLGKRLQWPPVPAARPSTERARRWICHGSSVATEGAESSGSVFSQRLLWLG